MEISECISRRNTPAPRPAARRISLAVTVFAVLFAGCSQITRPETEPFYAPTAPPPVQEFRWSNGKMPKSFDPARAANAPETDIVRAIYEGLTDIDAKTLKEVPGVAERWESSADLRIWTFHLRKDARWSNGEAVIAEDFVNSWKRLVNLREKAANTYLFQNIVGMRTIDTETHNGEPTDFLHETPVETHPQTQKSPSEANTASKYQPFVHPDAHTAKPVEPDHESDRNAKKPAPPKFGVVAVDDRTLTVTLESPDKDLPKLVANPIFLPIYGDGVEFDDADPDFDEVTNGAFRMTGMADGGITLERADYYWNRQSVGLERVRFVPMETAEKALEAYRAGSIDAVTNADFEPLALKLLSPYEDFRRTTHSSLNFYEFNPKNAPFADRRVREALAISIDRERLTEGELAGSTQPAFSFLPLGVPNLSALSLNIDHARDLLEKAGYPNGANFPVIRLVINRNDTQQRVAKTVARMWKQNLNVETLVIVKEQSEMDKVHLSGDFDLMRRGALMPTTDELVSLTSVFGPPNRPEESPSKAVKNEEIPAKTRAEKTLETPAKVGGGPGAIEPPEGNVAVKVEPQPAPTLNEEDAIFNVYAIPLYFPTSYSLVKPYVHGFEMNGLDVPSLDEVTIDNAWQPNSTPGESLEPAGDAGLTG